jgi:UPF0716 protein FxsA
MGLLVLAFIVVPIVEIAVIIRVGSAIGVFDTLGLLILLSLTGGWLVKREGLGVLRRVQASLGDGRVPAAELVDGFLVLLAGALLLVPGFVTDAFGLLLLLPPVRAVVRRLLARRFRARVTPVTGYIDLP